jgi:hypothetical protein
MKTPLVCVSVAKLLFDGPEINWTFNGQPIP